MNQFEESKIRLFIDGEDAKRSLAGLRQEDREITAEIRRMKEAGEENFDATASSSGHLRGFRPRRCHLESKFFFSGSESSTFFSSM